MPDTPTPPRKTTLVYLTGFMASGKSTIAPILANTLGFDCVDVDVEIEKKTGKRISELFQDHGEPAFREIEAGVLESIGRLQRCIVSLGGGTIASDRNIALIKSSGLLVYLRVETEQIFHRVRYKTDRPLLRSPGGTTLTEDELRSAIEALLRVRLPYYQQADITICTGDKRIGMTVDDLVRRLRPFIE